MMCSNVQAKSMFLAMPRKTSTDNTPVMSAASVQKNADKSDRMLLAESIHAIVKNMEGFQKAYNEFQAFNESTINKFDQNMTTKQQDFEDFTRKLENDFENKKIEMLQAFKRDKWEAAVDVLKEEDHIPVKQAEYDKIVNEFTNLQASHTTTVTNMEKQHKIETERQIKNLEERLSLEKQAEIAKLQAQFEQKVSEVKRLEDVIDKSYKEIEAQRALTREVSQAASQSRVTVNSGNLK